MKAYVFMYIYIQYISYVYIYMYTYIIYTHTHTYIYIPNSESVEFNLWGRGVVTRKCMLGKPEQSWNLAGTFRWLAKLGSHVAEIHAHLKYHYGFPLWDPIVAGAALPVGGGSGWLRSSGEGSGSRLTLWYFFLTVC